MVERLFESSGDDVIYEGAGDLPGAIHNDDLPRVSGDFSFVPRSCARSYDFALRSDHFAERLSARGKPRQGEAVTPAPAATSDTDASHVSKMLDGGCWRGDGMVGVQEADLVTCAVKAVRRYFLPEGQRELALDHHIELKLRQVVDDFISSGRLLDVREDAPDVRLLFDDVVKARGDELPSFLRLLRDSIARHDSFMDVTDILPHRDREELVFEGREGHDELIQLLRARYKRTRPVFDRLKTALEASINVNISSGALRHHFGSKRVALELREIPEVGIYLVPIVVTN